MRAIIATVTNWYLIIRSSIKKRIIRPVADFADKINYPGAENITMLQIGRFFYTGILQGDINARARSISFDFFLALFPTIIFFFTLIPYIPIDGFQDRILFLLQEVLPRNTFDAARSTIDDILRQPRGGLLSFGFLFALYVSTNGINSMIESFNQSYHGIAVRTGFRQRLVSIFITLMIALLVIFSIGLIIFSEVASNYLEKKNLLNSGTQIFLLQTGKWIILIGMTLITISTLYFYGPSKKNRRPFISVGSVAATVLLLLASIAFNYFIVNFSQYNKIYGSIGTLIILLVWINFNSLLLIIGFELNASIENAIHKAHLLQDHKSIEDQPIHRSM